MNSEPPVITGDERRIRVSEHNETEADNVVNHTSPSGDAIRAKSPSGATPHAPSPQPRDRSSNSIPASLVTSTPLPQPSQPRFSHTVSSSSVRQPLLEDLDIGEELRAELRALPAEERDREVAILAALQPLDRERASNFARNRVIMGSIGLSTKEINQFMGAKRGRKGNGKGKAIARDEDSDDDSPSDNDTDTDNGTDNDDRHDITDSGDEDDEVTDDNEQGTGAKQRKVATTKTVGDHNALERAATTAGPSATLIHAPAFVAAGPELDRNLWPAWMTEAYGFLSEYDLNEDFAKAIVWWAAVERKYDFKTSVRFLHIVSDMSSLMISVVAWSSDHLSSRSSRVLDAASSPRFPKTSQHYRRQGL